MSLLYLFGAALGAGFGLLALLVPQKTVQLCVEDDLQLRFLGNFALRMLGAVLLTAAMAAFEQAGGLPAMSDVSALTRWQLSHFNDAAAEIIAPAAPRPRSHTLYEPEQQPNRDRLSYTEEY